MNIEMVRQNWKEFEEYLITTRYSVRDPETGRPVEKSWNDLVQRFELELRSGETSNICPDKAIDEIVDAIRQRYIIPASPFLMTFGNPHTRRKGYFSCYPLGHVEDSMEGIYKMCEMMKEIYIRGGGCGIDLSKLRPRNAHVDNKQGISSGPVGFLHLFDAVTGTTNQGGRRRGALLVQMHWKHPDIEKFIKAKFAVPALSNVVYQFPEDERVDIPLQNMNISVVVDSEFWEKGKELLDLIAENMWKSGDPGLLFLDNMRKFSPFNPKKYGERHDPVSSNPCGEYLAPPFTACNLITINVAKIASDSLKNNQFDFDLFYRNVARYAGLAVYLGSYLVSRDDGYPLPEIKEMTQEVRPVGVGMTGLHTALLLAYDGHVKYGKDKESIEFAQKTQAALTIGTLATSAKLTERTKIAYEWNPEYLEMHIEELSQCIEDHNLPLKEELELITQTAKVYRGFYNSITTSQPPTGSVSQFAHVGGDTGIEPMYAVELQRRVRDFHSNSWKTVTIVTEYIADRLQDPKFRKRVEEQLAYNVKPEEQLAVLEAVQKFVHTGVSKTINVPEETSPEQIKNLITASKRARLKGFTVFRENCRSDTVYISPRSKENKKEEKKAKETELSPVRKALVYEVKGPVNAYITTTFDEESKVREVFISVGKAGTTLNGMFQALGRIMSVALREYPDLVERFIETLEGIETGEFYICNGISGKSLPDMIAKIVRYTVEKFSRKENSEKDCKDSNPNAESKMDLCPACGKLTLSRSGGCKTCKGCGFTTC